MGCKKRFQNGTFVISYPPYGYDNVGGEMVIVPEQAGSCEVQVEHYTQYIQKNPGWQLLTVKRIPTCNFSLLPYSTYPTRESN